MLTSAEATVISEEAIKAIKEAFQKDERLKHWDILNAGGSRGFNDLNLKIKFVDTTVKPLSPLGGEQTTEIVKQGLAAAGTKIFFRGRRYTVVKAATKNYQAICEDDGKPWALPFALCSLAN